MSEEHPIYRQVLERVKAIPESIHGEKNVSAEINEKQCAFNVYQYFSKRHVMFELYPRSFVQELMSYEFKNDYDIRSKFKTEADLVAGVFTEHLSGNFKHLAVFTNKTNQDKNGFFFGGAGVYAHEGKVIAYHTNDKGKLIEKDLLDLTKTSGGVLMIPTIQTLPSGLVNANVMILSENARTGAIREMHYHITKLPDTFYIRKILIDKQDHKPGDDMEIFGITFPVGKGVLKSVEMLGEGITSFESIEKPAPNKVVNINQAKRKNKI